MTNDGFSYHAITHQWTHGQQSGPESTVIVLPSPVGRFKGMNKEMCVYVQNTCVQQQLGLSDDVALFYCKRLILQIKRRSLTSRMVSVGQLYAGNETMIQRSCLCVFRQNIGNAGVWLFSRVLQGLRSSGKLVL